MEMVLAATSLIFNHTHQIGRKPSFRKGKDLPKVTLVESGETRTPTLVFLAPPLKKNMFPFTMPLANSPASSETLGKVESNW